MSEHELVSLAEAQTRIGFKGDSKGRRLRAALEERETRHGVQFLDRRRGPRRVNYRVTVAAIRKYAADLIETPAEQLEREVRGYLRAIDERIDERVGEQVRRRVDPELKRLREQDARTLGLVRDLSKQVNTLASLVRPSAVESNGEHP